MKVLDFSHKMKAEEKQAQLLLLDLLVSFISALLGHIAPKGLILS